MEETLGADLGEELGLQRLWGGARPPWSSPRSPISFEFLELHPSPLPLPGESGMRPEVPRSDLDLTFGLSVTRPPRPTPSHFIRH